MRESETSSVAVERALAIMESIAHRAAGLTNAEIARKLTIPKSSASYILKTLERTGYLRRERGTGKYLLGLKLLSLTRAVDVASDLRELARPTMRALVESTQLTAHLAILDRGEAVYIEKVDTPGFIKMDTWIGRRMDVHSTSVGKALLAMLSEAETDAILAERGLNPRTAKTITDASKLMAEFKRIRSLGFAVDDEENSQGVRCVAAAILDAFGRPRAALGLSGTTAQIGRGSVARLGGIVSEAAKEISVRIGYGSPVRG